LAKPKKLSQIIRKSNAFTEQLFLNQVIYKRALDFCGGRMGIKTFLEHKNLNTTTTAVIQQTI
jgi:hypothetical protein